MSIRIENRCQISVPFNVERTIQRLLKKVPQDHLVGLEAIIILDRVTHKPKEKAGGIYSEKRDLQPAEIEVALNAIFRGMPRVLFFLPFIAQFSLATVLYHELGHHYQRFAHGVRKEQREEFAEAYKKQMLKKAFFWWRLLLLPLAPVVHWLHRKAQRSPLSKAL